MDLIKGAESISWKNFSSALLLETTRGDKIFTSTCVAIAKNVLLTTAHCLDGVEGARVILDSEYKKESTNAISVQNFSIHPDYNPQDSFYQNDIAIIFLEKDLPDTIQLPKIDNHVNLWSANKLNRIGFGGRNNKNRKTWTDPTFVDWQNNNHIIRLNDTCAVTGDSGGPIYHVQKSTPYLVGLHSTLEGSSVTYAIFVPEYKQWIHEVIASNYFLLVS